MNREIRVDLKLTALEGNHFAIVRLPERMQVLASTLRNGGYVEADTVLMMQVDKGYDGQDPVGELREICRRFKLPQDTVCFMTAADLHKVITTASETYHGVQAVTVATAGVINAVMAGELLPESLVDSLKKPGTINILVAVNQPLEPAGLANAIITITEAKTAAMMDTGVRGTGTTSDAVAIACRRGKGTLFAGTATDVGIAIARSVRRAVGESIRKWDGRQPLDMLTMLERRGITMEVLWRTAQELYYENPEWDTEDIRRRFVAHLQMLNDDVNVTSMIHAAMLIEEAGYRDEIHALRPGEFQDDPMHLVADEMLGIALAEYISGTRGLFEYTRYDKKKPGILKELGPFLDDIVGSLIGATMSKIYTDLLGAGR
jgi:adenosylcobinamide hydrolase